MDEEELEDEELEEQEDEEDEEEQENLEQEMQEAEDKKKKLEEKALKTKLTMMAGRLVAKGAVVLNAQDKKTVKDAKKHKNLKEDINKINAILIANKVKKTVQTVGKVASSGPPGWYVLLGCLIIFLVICVFFIVLTIMQNVLGGAGSGGGSEFGINGKDFYGARMIYKNDEIAAVSMIEDYVELVEIGIDSTTSITTASKDGKTYDVEVTVNIAMPEEDYNYEEFNEVDFQTQYAVLYETIFDVAKLVYKADNGADTTATTLVECVDGILYFGYGETVMADISTLLTNKIVENIAFTSEDDTESKLTLTDIQNIAKPKLTTLYSEAKYKVRTEKLFIKDFILESDDAKVSGVAAENYVAMIFMPKKNVTFNKFSFVAGGENLSDFTMNLTNNGSAINIEKDETNYGKDLPEEEGSEETSKEAYIYMTSEDLGISASAFEDIDTNNLTALKDGMSLFDVVENVQDYSIYLELSTAQNSIQVYTFKQNGVVVTLSCSNPFTFVEFETLWQAN